MPATITEGRKPASPTLTDLGSARTRVTSAKAPILLDVVSTEGGPFWPAPSPRATEGPRGE